MILESAIRFHNSGDSGDSEIAKRFQYDSNEIPVKWHKIPELPLDLPLNFSNFLPFWMAKNAAQNGGSPNFSWRYKGGRKKGQR